ncbi:Eco57I restriction-modification methylase domain-containing protein [Paraburkholderia agricolaris]|uniref:Eco57I restriction-modification methylase domain-containing protein n=1 Tax=Paraburkholderia agricolaris TaxID=2152888 RepID=UPI00129102DA|nr:DNA methyltransferase [Paraburkholderia agricolaris]
MLTKSINNQPLAKVLRTQLESTVKMARDVAEKGARAALAQIAVAEAKAPDYLTDEFKALRRRLRAHGRALGDVKASDDAQGIQHLVWEVAYEHWHRMLFARFLAENGLLLWEPGAAVSLDDCEALVQETDLAMNLGAKTKWELAGKLAARMLPQVFKPQSPVFELAFAPEHQRELERLLGALPAEVFKASDSLGWVYQFWQAKRKDEVNASEVKIGADELPAVTQLFTEPYMVDFLLHNSLGAWWMTRHPAKTCPVPLTYLRTLEDGTPAAGKFDCWPDCLADFKLLDPCCGSGHFLVAAFLMLAPMRMEAEGLSAKDAVDAVLADNLHGLELDARCVEIAVFALALAAWRFPDENGDPLGARADMPTPNIACCGLRVAASSKDWEALVPDGTPNFELLRQELQLLHASFAQAPLLGSLLDPTRNLKNDLATPGVDTLQGLLRRALATETAATLWNAGSELNDDTWDLALTAQGLLEAARLLDARYHLVITNVPYLARGKQDDNLKHYCETYYAEAKNDLANVFLERCLELSQEQGHGVVQIVMPQNWLFLTSYKKQREQKLRATTWRLAVLLGAKGFQTPMWDFNVQLLTLSSDSPPGGHNLYGLDVSGLGGADQKATGLTTSPILQVTQRTILQNPDYRIVFGDVSGDLLNGYAVASQGLPTSDSAMFVRNWWEIRERGTAWEFHQSTVSDTTPIGGCEYVVLYEQGNGQMRALAAAQERDRGRDRQGANAWGRHGVAVSLMSRLPASLYFGSKFDNNVSAVVPKDPRNVAAIWAFCSSKEFHDAVRMIDKKLNVTNATLGRVPFELGYWAQVAAERFPKGLPKPQTNDPTQWFFHGHPQPSTDPLQVAVARLLGYRWPAETDSKMELSDEARAWIAGCETFADLVDDDGIVCLPPVRGEKPAHERLLNLLIAAWDTVTPGSWKPSILDKLLGDADCAGKGLDVWLRDKFFEQHAKRFYHRPFIWHVWDGMKDGFAALVNYHQLDAKNLERLIHTYLGDWIRQQEIGVRDGVDGAPARLAAAQNLKRRLEFILEGEAPYDVFVRWKPLADQPIGWYPDLNDGVRLNIRPFIAAEVLRHNKKPRLNIAWDKDRGKDVDSAPWFKTFQGERINDHHLTVAEKREAQAKTRG